MLRGLYESATGMRARQILQDVTANNLANVNSTGFQRQVVALHSSYVLTEKTRASNPSPFNTAFATEPIATRDTTPGLVQPTSNPHDVALSGPGYLMVKTSDGDRLVRSASLTLNASGEVALPTGEPVLGASGAPIPVGSSDWKISESGTITSRNGQVLGRLRLVMPNTPLTPTGNGMSAAAEVRVLAPGTVNVLSGHLERSNVDPVREMVDMISGMRAYEANQKSIQAQDQTLENLFTLLR